MQWHIPQKWRLPRQHLVKQGNKIGNGLFRCVFLERWDPDYLPEEVGKRFCGSGNAPFSHLQILPNTPLWCFGGLPTLGYIYQHFLLRIWRIVKRPGNLPLLWFLVFAMHMQLCTSAPHLQAWKNMIAQHHHLTTMTKLHQIYHHDNRLIFLVIGSQYVSNLSFGYCMPWK